jgi:hypothetical protein
LLKGPGFSKFIKGKHFRRIFNFFIFKQFFGQYRMNGRDSWGPDRHLDNQIDQFD